VDVQIIDGPDGAAPPRRRRGWRRVAIGLPPLLLAAVLSLTGSETAAPSTVETSSSALAGDLPTPLPRISAPPLSGRDRGQLMSSTGRRFVPRGTNYVRLQRVTKRDSSYHSTFEPGLYDGARAEAMLAQMQHDGYNVVRVFIDMGDDRDTANGEPHGLGRGAADQSTGYAPYYDNVADFVLRAARHRVYVLPSIDAFPHNAYYRSFVAAAPTSNVAGYNALHMHRGAVDAKRAYARHFVEEMRDRIGRPLLSTFLAIQLDNEATFSGAQAPFDKWSGTVVAPDGLTYRMDDRAQRQQAADASMVVYANQAVDAVHEVDPDMMVTVGMFTYRAVGKSPDGFSRYCSGSCPGEYRYPGRPSSLSHWSDLSFLDIHIYPWNNGWTLEADLASSEWSWVRGPIVMGEFGAYRLVWNGNVTTAAYGMRDLQVASCRHGFAGWIYWTWDTEEDPIQRQFFSLSYNRGAVNGVLAPIVRPDPCRT
jgi:hypothetical protein